MAIERMHVVDSHTAGEPTRVIVGGGPDLGSGPLAERRERLRRDFDRYRCAAVNEPRGSEVIVGALLVEPEDRSCAAGVIFFNNVGAIGMCGHGTIGVMATLAYLRRIGPGEHRIETPVGVVTATLHGDHDVSVRNVPSWRARRSLSVQVPGLGPVAGDVAYGGNWFFLVERHGEDLALANVGPLADLCARIRGAVNAQGYPEVDHVELFAGAQAPGAHARNFVLCPGGAYDRSPCGTGTSAKLACLAADGKLAEGATWVQESILGSTFSASYRWLDRAQGRIEPTVRGQAYVNAESTLLLDPDDPLCWGVRSP